MKLLDNGLDSFKKSIQKLQNLSAVDSESYEI